jgi:hypothetical protein
MQGLDEAAKLLTHIFEGLGIDYAIMGGMAVRMHALPRPTYDLDFTLAIERSALPSLFAAAESAGFVVPEGYRSGWVDRVAGLPLLKLKHYLSEARSIDVDIFLAETPFQESVLQRRQRHSVDGWEAWFVSAEDLILLKLLADRPRDRIDVADILFVQGKVDEVYLRNWAHTLRIGDRLESALSKPDEASDK